MARITVEDCLQAVDNRFELVMVASKRAHALATGGKTALVPEEGDKPTVIALRELAEGKITREQVMAANKHDDEPEIDLGAELGAASL